MAKIDVLMNHALMSGCDVMNDIVTYVNVLRPFLKMFRLTETMLFLPTIYKFTIPRPAFTLRRKRCKGLTLMPKVISVLRGHLYDGRGIPDLTPKDELFIRFYLSSIYINF